MSIGAQSTEEIMSPNYELRTTSPSSRKATDFYCSDLNQEA